MVNQCSRRFLVLALLFISSVASSFAQGLQKPRLSLPKDGSEVQVKYPNFFWYPSMKTNVEYPIRYQFILVPMEAGQTPCEALALNRRMVDESVESQTQFRMPMTAEPLEVGRKYAWQVIVIEGDGSRKAESECWHFAYQIQPEHKDSTSIQFIELKHITAQSVTILPDDTLRLKVESLQEKPLLLTISSVDGGKKPYTLSQTLYMRPGQNYVPIGLKPKALRRNKLLKVEIIFDNQNYDFYVKGDK